MTGGTDGGAKVPALLLRRVDGSQLEGLTYD